MRSGIVIAVDGPGSSGKGTISKLVAQRLNLIYLDTGAMYRTLTYACLEAGINIDDELAVMNVLSNALISISLQGEMMIGDLVVEAFIRTEEVSHLTSSTISKMPKVRKAMVEQQRAYAQDKNVIIDGRDIATVVFPHADMKLFMSAALLTRAQRRYEQDVLRGLNASLDETIRALAARDKNDILRSESPLRITDGSTVIDSTYSTIEHTVDRVCEMITNYCATAKSQE